MRKPNRRKPLGSSNIKRCPSMAELLTIPSGRIVDRPIGGPEFSTRYLRCVLCGGYIAAMEHAGEHECPTEDRFTTDWVVPGLRESLLSPSHFRVFDTSRRQLTS